MTKFTEAQFDKAFQIYREAEDLAQKIADDFYGGGNLQETEFYEHCISFELTQYDRCDGRD